MPDRTHRRPREAGLRALQDEHLEKPSVVVDGHPPFLVVVANKQGVERAGPPASSWHEHGVCHVRASRGPPVHWRRPKGAWVSGFDVAVIGAGIHGASAAYHLSKDGARTVIFDRGTPASGPTGRSSAVC